MRDSRAMQPTGVVFCAGKCRENGGLLKTSGKKADITGMSDTPHRSRWLAALGLVLAVRGETACKPSTGIGAPPQKTSATGATGGNPSNDHSRGATPGAGNITPTPQTSAPQGSDTFVDYPTLTFNGQGTTNCSQQLQTTTQIVSRLSKAELSIESVALHVDCYTSNIFAAAFGHACDDQEFNAQILSDARGATIYSRYTSDDALRDRVSIPGWAIMAKSITSNKGALYRFDRPLPVFPLPAALARYRDLDQPQTFTALVSGAANAQVSMTVSKVGIQGDIIRLRFEMVVNGRPNEAALYNQFPIPRSSEFDINTTALDVRGIRTDDLFVDGKGCSDGGSVSLTYQLCRKQSVQGSEDTRQPFCQ